MNRITSAHLEFFCGCKNPKKGTRQITITITASKPPSSPLAGLVDNPQDNSITKEYTEIYCKACELPIVMVERKERWTTAMVL